MEYIKKDAEFSECRKYRYLLIRVFDDTKPLVNFVGLNPSTADENQPDPTMDRCVSFAKEWGYGGIVMTNLFAFVDTEQEEIWDIEDKIGKQNNDYLIKAKEMSKNVVVAWGNDEDRFKGRDKEVLKILGQVDCLEKNETGDPKHPLYANGGLTEKPYNY